MPKYKVVAHHRVQKFLTTIKNENLKQRIINHIIKLENYPLTLKNMDIKKIKGLQKTFRIRIGNYRIIFQVDKKQKTIYVTHAETRKNAYSNLS
ncbi:MAG: type II toxin-antitoxin system RelE/ParE family toxin [Candidatus Bathyarchaeota archaeon]|nr:MAG: type II toxin-antitoxin system RelE/ParE family toxin [Candidatus Bathyarchaeum tardum]WNZ29565.1 MAG: type II toxin-antitoxin system RelE/ParE family toxin [Candidatus Bathyarchaeota archaeon]